jgi:hypothetical protein
MRVTKGAQIAVNRVTRDHPCVQGYPGNALLDHDHHTQHAALNLADHAPSIHSSPGHKVTREPWSLSVCRQFGVRNDRYAALHEVRQAALRGLCTRVRRIVGP